MLAYLSREIFIRPGWIAAFRARAAIFSDTLSGID
jgi:hypothetical protein